MARKTIYIKPDKEELYEQAVKLSDEKSLSAVIEKAVQKIVWEKGVYLKDALFAKTLDLLSWPKDFPTMIIYRFIQISFGSLPDELLDKADYILEIFEYKKLLNSCDGIWKSNEENEMKIFEYDGDLEWLEEMYELTTSPKFEEYEKEYHREIKEKIENLEIDEKTKKHLLNKIDRN